jgi:D-alanyl-D-alanine carboxypeptidase
MRRRITAGAVAAGTAALLVLTAAPAGAAAAARVVPSDRTVELQAALDAVHAAGVPGLFAEVRDGTRTWRGVSGVANVTTGTPMRPGFEQRIGSLTKTFVATVVLQLVAEGRVRLDGPIGRYLGDLLPPELASQVTVRMLLQHTSGIGDYPLALFQSPQDVVRYQTETVNPKRLVALGLALPRTNPPGAQFAYSNTNYILAGLIIERVTGRPAASEITRRILRPLRLTHTYSPGTNPRFRGPHANGYVVWPIDGTLRDFTEYNMSWAWMAGELTSTTHDLNNFYAALLSGRVLPANLLAEMRTVVPRFPADPDPEAAAIGLGIARARTPCGQSWGHGGGGFGFGTSTLRLADGSREVTVAWNLTLYDPTGPIDPAVSRFLIVALCGSQTTATAWLPIQSS